MDFSPNLIRALILWRSALGLLMGKFRPFLTELSACNTSVFYFQDNNLSKSQWIFTKFGMSIDIVEIFALGLLIGKFRQFLTKLSAHDMIMAGYYHFTFYFMFCPVLFIMFSESYLAFYNITKEMRHDNGSDYHFMFYFLVILKNLSTQCSKLVNTVVYLGKYLLLKSTLIK